MLDSTGIDNFIAAEEKQEDIPLSTDMNLYLEYSTPKGNYLGWNFTSNYKAIQTYASSNVVNGFTEFANEKDLSGFMALAKSRQHPRFSLMWHRSIQEGLDQISDEHARDGILNKLRHLSGNR